ncbi:peptidyl-tRNA hydrolase [Pseudomonas nitritireducens]|uniref:peptidyl-tRNA hydrolase n=1 Tax=Pseudomonas nitroreducens TaxID=46680 RepID=A0A7W7KQI4_PSENT|nr:peptidyl-tRNA hydrolase [Pseudomonas nitritireducens]MBB4866821.1 peptidyl-tRNA hydrolase [Pseudomonas nitritireducens]
MLNIYVRNDLNMRLGKLASQCAHSLTKAVLAGFSQRPDGRLQLTRSDYLVLLDFICYPEVKINLVPEQEILALAGKAHLVIDNGHTEFHGVQTLTAASESIFPEFREETLTDPTGKSDAPIRQYLIFSKEKKPSKERACEMAAHAQVRQLAVDLQWECALFEGDFVVLPPLNPQLECWLRSGYGKIAVSVTTQKELVQADEKLCGIEGMKTTLVAVGDSLALATSPAIAAHLADITGSMKLL